MSESSYPLSPDEDERDALTLTERHAVPSAPYALTAVLCALAALIVLQGVIPGHSGWARIASALFIGIATFGLLGFLRPRVSVLVLAIVAAELGMLYSLPTTIVFSNPVQHPEAFAALMSHLVGTGLIGFILARLLAVERYPLAVIPITFLFMFVVINLRVFMP